MPPPARQPPKTGTPGQQDQLRLKRHRPITPRRFAWGLREAVLLAARASLRPAVAHGTALLGPTSGRPSRTARPGGRSPHTLAAEAPHRLRIGEHAGSGAGHLAAAGPGGLGVGHPD